MSIRSLLVLLLSLLGAVARADGPRAPLVASVDAIGITVNDIDRAVDFYSKVLSFRKIAEREVAGEQHERLYGVFGMRLAIVTMRSASPSRRQVTAPAIAPSRTATAPDRPEVSMTPSDA